MTGTPGAQASAKWIADYFQRVGLKPLGKDFLFPFEFNSGERIRPEQTHCEITAEGMPPIKAALETGFRPLSFSENGAAEGDVVFVGYGLKVPEGNGAPYDSYAGVDVKNKIALILRYVPENVDPARRCHHDFPNVVVPEPDRVGDGLPMRDCASRLVQ